MSQAIQIIGTISLLLLFFIQFYMGINKSVFQKAGQTTLLWTSIYIFFLVFLRLLTLVHIGTTEQLRIISGFTSIIPLFFTLIQLFFTRKNNP
jgi:hypothetical protein